MCSKDQDWKNLKVEKFCVYKIFISAWTLSTFNGRSGGTAPALPFPAASRDLPRRKSLKVEEEAGLRPFTTARLSRVGLLPNLSRILEQDRKRSLSVTAPVRLMLVLALLYVCLSLPGLPGPELEMRPAAPPPVDMATSKISLLSNSLYLDHKMLKLTLNISSQNNFLQSLETSSLCYVNPLNNWVNLEQFYE